VKLLVAGYPLFVVSIKKNNLWPGRWHTEKKQIFSLFHAYAQIIIINCLRDLLFSLPVCSDKLISKFSDRFTQKNPQMCFMQKTIQISDHQPTTLNLHSSTFNPLLPL